MKNKMNVHETEFSYSGTSLTATSKGGENSGRLREVRFNNRRPVGTTNLWPLKRGGRKRGSTVFNIFNIFSPVVSVHPHILRNLHSL